MSNFTCLTLVTYDTFASKVWAFGMMQFGHQYLLDVGGLNFYKLLGSGKGDGFNPYPDWGTYALLTVWDDKLSAEAFISKNQLISRYKSKASSVIHYLMKPMRSHGLWSGSNPFEGDLVTPSDLEVVCIITRATIKWSKLRTFWKYVPTSKLPLVNNPDLIYTKGIGEVPFVQMATFSIWKNLDAMKQFAYNSKEHSTAVKMTRDLDWYKEELFARFILVDCIKM